MRLIIDLDNTLTIDDKNLDYAHKRANLSLINTLKTYKNQGFKISIFTARNMKTFSGDLEKIQTHTLPVIEKWLKTHEVPFDEIIIGKPWCGEMGFWVDDKAIRPSEFASLSFKQIHKLLNKDLAKMRRLNKRKRAKKKQK